MRLKDVRNLFRLKKEIDDTKFKDIRNLSRLKMRNEAIQIRDIKNLFQHEKEDCYKPERGGNFWSNNYIDYESNGDRNKTLNNILTDHT